MPVFPVITMQRFDLKKKRIIAIKLFLVMVLSTHTRVWWERASSSVTVSYVQVVKGILFSLNIG